MLAQNAVNQSSQRSVVDCDPLTFFFSSEYEELTKILKNYRDVASEMKFDLFDFMDGLEPT